MIVTPLGETKQLAAACKLNNINGHVVPVGDFSAIVQDASTLAESNSAAETISKLVGKHEVLLLSRADEHIDAGHYRNGLRESDVPAGLALNNLPDMAEKLLLDQQNPHTAEGSIDVSTMTKLQASAALMTPERASLARTALLWMVVALIAFIGIVVGAFVALIVEPIVWAAVVLAVFVFGFALYRINALLARRK